MPLDELEGDPTVGFDIAGAIEDEAGVETGGFDVQATHGFDGVVILGANGGLGTAAIALVAVDAAIEAGGIRGVDVDGSAEEATNGLPVQGEESFDD